MTDAILIQRVLDGDDSAFTQLVDRHAPACLRFATRMLGIREDAEDATQEALLRAYSALASYDPSRAFRTWLFTILVNRCRTMALRRQRRETRVIGDNGAVSRAAAEPAVAMNDSMEELNAALARLDPLHREAFLLKHVEELSYEEMSAATGAGVSALKMRVMRACDQLEAMLRDGDHD